MSSTRLPPAASRPQTASTDAPTPRPPQHPFPSSETTDDTTTTTTTATATATTLPRPPFAPFFTLIQDATTASHFHPTVRYVFSDDDFDPLAVLPQPHESLPGSLANSHHAAGSTPHSGSGSQADVDSNHGGSGTFGKAHPHRRRDRDRTTTTTGSSKQHISAERVLLVDVSADGTGILAAHSLSPDWQINAVSVTKAPTWLDDTHHSHTTAGSTTRHTNTSSSNANTDGGGGGGGGGLMLTIEGVGRHRRKTSDVLPLNLPGKDGKGKSPVDALEELVGVYAERLERLQSVVDWAEGRKPVGGDVTRPAG
ncbi:hypothetical protein TWF696_009234 [Orbilia brochopaga]|uniref:Uncharacterized protein n=1 Tax=Orbilia brochopaga TaxID=3140254 RepID=A0AAV9UFC1_9PEZI